MKTGHHGMGCVRFLYATPEMTLLLVASTRLLVSTKHLHFWPTSNTSGDDNDQTFPTMEKEPSHYATNLMQQQS